MGAEDGRSKDVSIFAAVFDRPAVRHRDHRVPVRVAGTPFAHHMEGGRRQFVRRTGTLPARWVNAPSPRHSGLAVSIALKNRTGGRLSRFQTGGPRGPTIRP